MDATACGAAPGSIDHAVLVVGYGSGSEAEYKNSNSSAFWIVRNSWGPSWGEQGYIRLAYGENSCNIATCFSSYVCVEGSDYCSEV